MSGPSLLAVAGDPGGATALEPVIRRLRASSDVTVVCAAYGPSLELWSLAGLQPHELRDVDVSGFERIILGTSVNREQRELDVIRRARRLRIPTTSIVDFGARYRERFTTLDGTLVVPDAILVMDDHARTEMIAAGFAAGRLHVTGHPGADGLGRYAEPARRAELRAWVHAFAGGAGDELVVVYISQPLSHLGNRESFGFDERDTLPAVTASLGRVLERRSRRAALLVKLHPREAGQAVDVPRSLPPCLRVRVIDDLACDPRELVVGADLVVGMNSILLVDACLLRLPVVSYQPGLRGADSLPSNRHGWSRAVYAPAALDEALDEELFDPAARRARQARLSEIARPAGATDRVIEALNLAAAGTPEEIV